MNEKSRAMIDQIRQMQAQKHSIKKIAVALRISRNTVRRYIRQIAEVAVPELDDTSVPVSAIDWDAAVRERNLGRPVKRIFEELQPPMGYSHFSRLLKQHDVRKPTIAIKLHHEPGEKSQVDYADGLKIINPKTGAETKTQFFCGVLPASSYTFGEFSMSQKLPDFIRSHERMWAYFGGVTKYVVLDNLKSGVSRAHRYDPEINPTYCDFANHAGFAALPARVRTPRDKAAVEATIGVIQRDFFDRCRNTKFYSLNELNQCFRKYLNEFNTRIMAEYGCSRVDRFKSESELLQPLKADVYEMYEWKTAKVHPDSCIELSRSLYSVPYKHVQNKVQVKFSDKVVIILDESGTEVLASHARKSRFKNSINEEHLPPSKIQTGTFDVLRIRKFAASIGPNTKEYVTWQFDSDAPLRSLRRMQGLMRFYETKVNSKSAMEFAAGNALQYKKRELRYFENCAVAFSNNGAKPSLVNPPQREMANIHLQN